MDKIEELYNLYLEEGLITEATTIDNFRMADGSQQGQLFELGKSNGLFKTTTPEQFSGAWVEEEPLKKKRSYGFTFGRWFFGAIKYS
tara:strand:+ start:434 stop:694 length:261 start_codon:yes stop_codon:yes gene_type:complete